MIQYLPSQAHYVLHCIFQDEEEDVIDVLLRPDGKAIVSAELDLRVFIANGE